MEKLNSSVEDAFDLFSLTPQFDLPVEVLEKAFVALQQSTHPDAFSTKSEMARRVAAHFSSRVNQGYEHLKNPLMRAELLLKRGDCWPVVPCHDILEEAFALGEEGRETRNKALFQEKIAAFVQKSSENLSTAFLNKDWNQASRAYLRLSYLEKLRSNAL